MKGWCDRVACCIAAWMLIATANAQSGFATVTDTAEGAYGPNHSTFFVLVAVDGKDINNALQASLQASHMRGAAMKIVPWERPVQAGKTSLKLRGTEASPAPILGLFREMFRGGIPDVTGTVEVELQPDKRYRVNGQIDAYRQAVWLEEVGGAVVPGSQVQLPPNPEVLKAMDGAAFTTTNLRYDGDWISDAPSPGLPFVPVGSRLKVLDAGSNRANVMIDGRKMRIGVDYARKEQTIGAMIARLTSAQDPRGRIAEWPEPVRNAVRAGRVMPGMTREQVEIALGRPRMDLLPSTAADEWPYSFGAEEIFVVFGTDGLLKEVDASRKGRAQVLMPTSAAAPTAAGAAAPAAASAPR